MASLKRSAGLRRRFAALATILALLGSGLTAACGARDSIEIPPMRKIAQRSTIVGADKSGTELGFFPAAENRIALKTQQIPAHVFQAVMAAEDPKFFQHNGVDVARVVGAAVHNATSPNTQGASTITMQWVKITRMVGNDRTLVNYKIPQARIAAKLEATLNPDRVKAKWEILTGYCNDVYFGRGATGLEAASRAYFGHGIGDKKLTLAKAATLAAVIKAPSTLPLDDAGLKARRDYVLDVMGREDIGPAGKLYAKISAADVAKAKADPIAFAKWNGGPSHYDSKEPALADWVHFWFQRTFPEDPAKPEQNWKAILAGGGLKITTTIDPAWQTWLNEAVAANPLHPSLATGVTIIDPGTGKIRAFYAGNKAGFKTANGDKNNYAFSASRQGGSTGKVFVLADFFRHGYSAQSQLPAAKHCVVNGTPITDRNLDPANVSVIDATRDSRNIPFSEIITGEKCPLAKPDQKQPLIAGQPWPISPQSVSQLTLNLGANDAVIEGSEPPKWEVVPNLALGSNTMTTFQRGMAFATLINHGKRVDGYLIERVDVIGGGNLYKYTPKATEGVLTREAADTTLKVLAGTTNGTAKGLAIKGHEGQTAQKTGTMDENKDAAYLQGNSYAVCSAWTGRPDNKPMPRVVTGADVGQICKHFLDRTLKGKKPVTLAPNAKYYDGGTKFGP